MNARFGFVLAAICAGFLAACGGGGGGGGGTNPLPSVSPSATPPASVQVTLAAQPTSVPFPSGAGLTGAISFPAGSGTAVITASAVNPSPVPVLQSKARQAVTQSISGGNVSVGYFTLTAQGGPVTLQGLPGFTATVPAGSSSGPYFVAFYDTRGVVAAWESTTQNGGTADANRNVTVPATTSPTITVAQNASIYLAVYYGNYIPPYNLSGCVGQSQTPLALRKQSLVGVHPITNGNAYTYSGSLTDTIVRSSPCPIPTTTANASVTVQVTETTAPAPTPAGATSDENSVETDAFATSTQTITTDSYVAASGSAFYSLGETSTDQGGNTVVTTYNAPGLQFAQSAEAAGNTWGNGAPATVTSNLADGSQYSRTYRSDGTYTETDTLPGGLTSAITENAGGSGSYKIGTSTSSQFDVEISAPSNGTITMTYAGRAHSVPAWYGSTLTAYSDVTNDVGLQAPDAACGNLPSGFVPSQAEKIVRTTTTVDAVLGYIDTRITTTWDQNPGGASSAPTGPWCVEINDVEKLFYDYSLDTNYAVYRTSDGNPIQTNTISEVYALTSVPTPFLVRRSAQSVHAFSAQIVARQAGIDFARTVQRAQRAATFARSIQMGRQGGRQ